MNTARAAAIVLGREIRAEMRTRELLQTTIVFAVIVVVLFNFAFESSVGEARRFGPGLIWIALLFSASLMLNPSFAREQSNDTIYALRMAPASSFAIVLGKTLANLLFLCITEVVLLPTFSVLYNVPLLPAIGRLALVLFLGTFGIVVVGTVFSALAAQSRLRELLLPLLLLPLLAPALIARSIALGWLSSSPSTWYFLRLPGCCAIICWRSKREMKRYGIANVITAVLLFFAGYAALFIAPDEATMHAIQRIFYFHASSGWAAMEASIIVFVANIAYLVKRAPKWDWLAVSAAEVGLGRFVEGRIKRDRLAQGRLVGVRKGPRINTDERG